MDSNNPVPQTSAPAPVTGELDGPITLLKFGWNILTKHWKSVGWVIVLPTIVSSIGQLLAATLGGAGAILAIILFIVSIILMIASLPAAVQAVHRVTVDPATPVSLKSQYRFGFSYFWSFILAAIIAGVVGFGSFILFIIPGVIVSVYTMFYIYTLVIDGKKGFSALTESFALVRGRWWIVFGNILFLGLVSFIIRLILIGVQFLLAYIFGAGMATGTSVGFAIIAVVINLIGIAIISPIAAGYTYKLYSSLKATRAAEASTKTFKKWLVAFLVIGILGGIVFVISVPMIALMSARSRMNQNTFNTEAFKEQIQQQIERQAQMQGQTPYMDTSDTTQGNRPGGTN
jgi:hypothetical protein